MIRFRCRCSSILSVPSDQAGLTIQCPDCGKLNDIPLLSDLPNLESDGLYKMEETIPLAEPERLQEQYTIFTRNRRNAAGEIDLRPTLDDVLLAGDDPNPKPKRSAARPKYDPLTGELVHEIGIKKDSPDAVDLNSIPMAKRSLEYATGNAASVPSPFGLLVRLLEAPNLIVMLFVLFAQVALEITLIPSAAGIFFIVPVLFACAMGIIAHYANVIEDTGPGQRDELPRLFRDAQFGEDIWRPFVHVAGATAISFGPAVVVFANSRGEAGPIIIAYTLLAVGLFVYPAMLLTTCTSGGFYNIGPVRVFSVIKNCGATYFLAIIVGTVGISSYFFGMGAITVAFLSVFTRQVSYAMSGKIAIAGAGALLAGIFLTHWFAWILGLLYRRHHGKFDWILQYHSKKNRLDTMAQLERLRREKGVAGEKFRAIESRQQAETKNRGVT